MKIRATPYVLIAPATLLLLAFGVLPILIAGFVSFTDMNLAGLGDWSVIKFIGLNNYTQLFADPAFWQSLGNTAFFALIGVPSVIISSLIVALLLNRSNSRFYRALRSLYFLPAITAIVAIALVWGYLYNTQFGLFNYLLSLVGVPPVQWLSDPLLAKFSVAFVAIWRGTGLNIIIFLAALQGVPREYLEAASLDGASEIRKTVSIVIPLLRFAIFFVMITTVIAWLQFFDEPFVLTKGGPIGATTSISLFLFQKGFSGSQFGYASAGSVILFLIIAVITLAQLRARKTDVEY
ncbi:MULTISPECIES: sugar ABC transporter permease [unclassified Cryobacterium]|uniref:carbohydrate ABC transporter permease n=1 Tax=unclassified Cryobacterium TaxID=2649013 RepID=UPI002AC920F8|nr:MULTISPECIES: sugar ABC transporter permease [Cryobacterium]MEB0001669.1 sugar ABC transporter permease [Cryobacterium sp. RTC2.1]MEB0286700.1 sugar ABC transporter permease [Cryobacterium sp. 10S3]MEB0303876.1 sugar ABC transporter permease [Cryobacterium sp. 10I1]MEC5148734.1 multiple sugar transport system permease protein [Cryobacterium psychrotolerans]WPX13179.1 sugar ABC transporter permease [Cryobacterium sp. 10S3]